MEYSHISNSSSLIKYLGSNLCDKEKIKFHFGDIRDMNFYKKKT